MQLPDEMPEGLIVPCPAKRRFPENSSPAVMIFFAPHGIPLRQRRRQVEKACSADRQGLDGSNSVEA
ncbi:hypothetical protein, partial [Streptomyces cinereoruber]|uniref:hypothetical protein n=1 Tax=Streptomyces cinereoruber TaxID=67260 RepID=UPI00363E1A78